MSYFKRLVPINAKLTLDYKPENDDENQRFKGSVKIESDDTFKAKEIRLEVRVVQTYQKIIDPRKNRTSTDYDPRHLQEFVIAGIVDAVKGYKQEFPFDIEIPFYRITLNEGSIWTSVKAIVNVEGRPDLTLEKTYTRYT